MHTFTEEERRDALVRRRIRFVVYYPALLRLVRADTHSRLEIELFQRVHPSVLMRIQTQEEYDRWLERTAEDPCWATYTREAIAQVRWGLFAKLINIVVYEIIANRELCAEADWHRLRPFLHVPIDSIVTDHLRQLDPKFPVRARLKGMTKADYRRIQTAIRALAQEHGVPSIWFETAWSA